MNIIVDKNLCNGCGACTNICPKSCIKMESDKMGFLYPSIDASLCIDCGKCKDTCPLLAKSHGNEFEQPITYAAWSNNPDIRYLSTTGGIFSELAIVWIAKGGYVVGAVYDTNHMVKHYMTNRLEDLRLLRQSKYVQSDTGDIYLKVKEKLITNHKVLFVGSPCQVEALKRFLRKDYENLLTCDFVCRGHNSPLAYAEYLKYLEQKYHSGVKRIWFKNKEKGWNCFGTRVEFENGKIYFADRYTDLYMRGYLEANLYVRPSCSHCHFKQVRRVADISLADFWGIGNFDNKLDSNQGTSLVFINSSKGQTLFNELSKSITYTKCNYEMAVKGNMCINSSIHINPYQKQFFRQLTKRPFDRCVKRYLKNRNLIKIKKCILKFANHILDIAI